MKEGERCAQARGAMGSRTDSLPPGSLNDSGKILGHTAPEEVESIPVCASEPPPQVEIVLPAHNEERNLAANARQLVAYLRADFPFRTRITIAENGSTDDTWGVIQEIERELPEVRGVQIAQPGKGRAIRSCWQDSNAEVLAFIDADLPFGLEALLPLVASLVSGHSDMAIGTRLGRGARISRCLRREIFSRGYNLLLHAVLGVGFSDAQCGFKAIRAEAARSLLPLTRDNAFFLDTELLVLAERAGLRVHEVPVDHVDDGQSSVAVLPTAAAHLRGIARLGWALACGAVAIPRRVTPGEVPPATRALPGQVVRFAGIGVASTIAYAVVYLMARDVLSAQAANALSLFVTALANTAANRRFTFGIRGRAHAARHQVQGLIAFMVGLAVTSAALAILHLLSRRPGHATEVTVLLTASALATVLRFVLYRTWVFRPRQTPRQPFPEAHSDLTLLAVPLRGQYATKSHSELAAAPPRSGIG